MNEKGTSELLHMCPGYRVQRKWKETDQIRDILDSRNVFVFDLPGDFQEVWNLSDGWFRSMGPEFNTRRQYVEHRMKQDRQAEKTFDAWLYTMRS